MSLNSPHCTFKKDLTPHFTGCTDCLPLQHVCSSFCKNLFSHISHPSFCLPACPECLITLNSQKLTDHPWFLSFSPLWLRQISEVLPALRTPTAVVCSQGWGRRLFAPTLARRAECHQQNCSETWEEWALIGEEDQIMQIWCRFCLSLKRRWGESLSTASQL